MRREVSTMQDFLQSTTKITKSLGPLWKSREGATRPMGILSTSHLRAILDGHFGDTERRDYAKSEIARRRADKWWCASQDDAETVREKQELDRLRGCSARARAEPVADRTRHKESSRAAFDNGKRRKAAILRRFEAIEELIGAARRCGTPIPSPVCAAIDRLISAQEEVDDAYGR